MATSMGSRSPQRRRFLVGVVALAVLAVVVAAVAAVLARDEPAAPVAQDRPGPVLLVPGYGGSTAALEVLAQELDDAGRDARVVAARGEGTQDLASQAADLGAAVDDVLDETGAASVDLVGYSAGGVVVRLYVADLGGGSTVRRAVTLASPHHGTALAEIGSAVGGSACPEACQQLDPDSDLLRTLNAGDETPDGPVWVALWTEDDATVVPPDSGVLEGALSVSVQSVCPDRAVTHPEVPRDAVVVEVVKAALAVEQPSVPGAEVC